MPSRYRIRSRMPLVSAVGLFCAISIAVVLAIDLYARYREDIASAKQAASNYADILGEHTANTFRSIEGKLRAVEEIRNRRLRNLLTRDQASAELSSLMIGSEGFVAVGWTDASGDVVAHSYDGIPLRNDAPNLSNFIVRRDGSDEGLFIALPDRSADGNRSVEISRRLSNADGSLSGLATARIDEGHLFDLARALKLGSRRSMFLLHRDGTVLAVQPSIAGAIGRPVADGPLLGERLRRSNSGYYETPGAADGVARVAAYDAVPGFPLVVLVSYAKADVLESWYRRFHADRVPGRGVACGG